MCHTSLLPLVTFKIKSNMILGGTKSSFIKIIMFYSIIHEILIWLYALWPVYYIKTYNIYASMSLIMTISNWSDFNFVLFKIDAPWYIVNFEGSHPSGAVSFYFLIIIVTNIQFIKCLFEFWCHFSVMMVYSR